MPTFEQFDEESIESTGESKNLGNERSKNPDTIGAADFHGDQNKPKLRRRKTNIPDEYQLIIAERIRHLRKKKGYTQVTLSTLSGIAMDSISIIELGKTNVSINSLRKLAKVLDCSVHELIPNHDFIDSIQVNSLLKT